MIEQQSRRGTEPFISHMYSWLWRLLIYVAYSVVFLQGCYNHSSAVALSGSKHLHLQRGTAVHSPWRYLQYIFTVSYRQLTRPRKTSLFWSCRSIYSKYIPCHLQHAYAYSISVRYVETISLYFTTIFSCSVIIIYGRASYVIQLCLPYLGFHPTLCSSFDWDLGFRCK